MVEIGDNAPQFSLPDTNGSFVNLSDFAGSKLLIYFYPKDNTPGCTKQACSLRDNFSPLKEKGVSVLGVSADKAAAHQGFTAKYNLNFPLLTDQGWETAKAFGSYGVKMLYGKEREGVLRQSYLIDGEGIIEKIWKRVKTASHGEDVLAYLEAASSLPLGQSACRARCR